MKQRLQIMIISRMLLIILQIVFYFVSYNYKFWSWILLLKLDKMQ